MTIILYLDIDGILNNNKSILKAYGNIGYKGYQELQTNSKLEYSILSIYEHLLLISNLHCQQLCKFIKKYKINNIVICSTWRLIFDVNQLKLLFLAKGYPEIANIITDITPNKITISTSKNNVKSIVHTKTLKNKSVTRIWLVITDNIKKKFLKCIRSVNYLSFREAEILYHYEHNLLTEDYIILDDDVKHLKKNYTSKFLNMVKYKK